MEEPKRFRSFFFRQRLNTVGIPFLAAVTLCLLFPGWLLPFLLILFATCFCVISCFLKTGEGRVTSLLLAAGIALALILCGAKGLEQNRNAKADGEKISAAGYVVFCSQDSFDLKEKAYPFRKIRIHAEKLPNLGDHVALSFAASASLSSSDRADGVDLLGDLEGDVTFLGKSVFYGTLGSIRSRLIREFGDGRTGGFYRAILLGDRSALTEEDKTAFEKTASSHILSISGLHIGYLLGMVLFLVRGLPLGRKFRFLILIPAIVLLFFFAGAGVSVFRASVMAAFALLASAVSRRYDSVTALVFAACALVLVEPYILLSHSFVFSFSATFGILVGGAPLSEILYEKLFLSHKEKRWMTLRKASFSVASSLLVALCVFAFTYPFQLFLTGKIDFLSPLFALVLIPLFSPCLTACAIQAVLLLLPFSVPFVGQILEEIGNLYLRFVSFLGKGTVGAVSLDVAAAFLGLLSLLGLIYLLATRKPIVSLIWYYLAIVFSSLLFLLVS